MARKRNKVADCLTVLAAILRARLLRARLPLAVSWSVTFRCNCRCEYCGAAAVPGDELTPAEALGLLDDIEALGTRWLTLSGGEPLLRKDIGELIGRALEKKMHVRVSTNGILAPGKIGELKGIDSVSVSLDGPEEVHDRVRGAGTFRGALAGVDSCREAGIPVDLMCTLSCHNLNTTDELMDIASRRGVGVMFQPATSWLNLGTQANPVAPAVAEYRKVMQALIQRKRSGAPILNSVAGLRYLACWPDPTDIRCHAGALFCCVQPDGAFMACTLFEDSCLGGKELLQASAAERFENAYRSRIHCRQCWCAPLVELNLALSLHPGAILNVLRMGL